MASTKEMAAANKLRLLREGELYRVGVAHSKALVGAALRPEALLHGAVDHAVGLAQARFGALLQPGGLSGLNLRSLLPYALTAGSFLLRKRRRLLKPAIGVSVALAAAAAWLLSRPRPPAPGSDHPA